MKVITRVTTQYDANSRLGAGFYNTINFRSAKTSTGPLSGSMVVGPYASRPLAKIDGARFVTRFKDKMAA